MNRATLASVTSIRILVSILLLLILFAVTLKTKQDRHQDLLVLRGKKICSIRTVLWILLGLYLLIYIYLTLSYRSPAEEARINLTPFWSYRSAVQFFPFKVKRKWLARQILLNILLTMPPGLLLPLLFHKAKHPFLLTAAAIFLGSILTEALQYATKRGLCETDDLLNNFLGGLLGMALLGTGAQAAKIIQKLKKETSA